MQASIDHYGNYYIDTIKELKGLGITKIQDGYTSAKNEWIERKTYKVTDLAFSKLKETYDIKMESLL